MVSVSWALVQGAANYNLYWSTSDAISRTTGDRKVTSSSAYTVTGLENGRAYYFAVTAVNAAGEESDLSPRATATPPVQSKDGVGMFEQCKHVGANPRTVPYACVWFMGDGYAQILKTGDTSAAIGIGIEFNAFERPKLADADSNGLRRIPSFQEGSIFFKKGTVSTLDGADQTPFAAMVLDPQTASFSVDMRYRNEWKPDCKSRMTPSFLRNACKGFGDSDMLVGFAFYASAGSAKWAFTPQGETPPAVPVNVFAYGVGPSLRVLPDWLDKNFVSFTAAVFFTQRIIQGGRARDMRHALFDTAPGSNDHTFTGVEPQLTLRINTVTVTASVPILNGAADRVSHGNLLLSVGLRTGALVN